MKRRELGKWVLGGVATSLVGAPSLAWADAAGDKLLTQIDQTIFRAKTQFLEYEGTIKVPEKSDRTLKLAISMKGEWRLTEFLGPSDMKGTKVLILSPTQMYIYLPAFKKVRRIASHTQEQGFMGMHFTQDDMSITNYAKMFSATVAKDDGKTVTLALTAKKDSGAPYPKLEIVAPKDKLLPSEIRYFNDAGTKLKTEVRSEYTCEKDQCAPSSIVMTDHTKGNASTTFKRTAWKVNPDIPDSKFSKRALEEGG